MPVFELKGTRRGRFRAFSRAQLPLLISTVFVTIEAAVALPEIAGSAQAVAGVAIVVAVSAVFLALPWERWPLWRMLPLAMLDVLGVALMRDAYYSDFPTVGLLAVFPVVWLAYAFGRWAIVLAVGSAAFIAFLPAFAAGELPSTPQTVLPAMTFPVIVAGLAIAVGEAARQLAGSQAGLRAANLRLERSLEQARDSAQLSRTIFESVSVALAFYDVDDRLVLANSLAEQAVGLAGFDLHTPPYAGPRVRRADNQTPIPFEDQIVPRSLRGELDDHEMEWIGPPGHQIAITATAQVVHRADGSVWGTLIAAHDVTDLARSLQVKDEFIATVSHELRTPLTSIIGYVEILRDDLDPEAVSMGRALETISRNAHNLQSRIKQLLDTADQRRLLEQRPADLCGLARRASATFTEQARAAGIDLEVEVAGVEPQWATVDADKVEQAIENLTSNAIKYTETGGRVCLVVTGDETHVQVTVRDTGIGMSADETAQAFDSFWRADSSRRGAVQGIGIGLGLVRDIVAAHQGTVHIESEPGVGTSVVMSLPRHC